MRRIIFAGIIVCFSQLCFAKELGKYGHTFEVKEEGFLSMIYRKLKDMDIEKQQREWQKLAKKRVEEPAPVAGIVKCLQARSFTYDPTYIVTEDIKLPGGGVLHKAGTKINPLDHISMGKEMIFIDARDKQQVKWFKEQRFKEQDQLILVGGRPLDLEQELEREVYFDQFGELTKRLGIVQVPAIVSQEGNLLRIKEAEVET